MSTQIRGFFDEWFFLNNYHPVPIDMDGELYPSVEHAYQAAKTSDATARERIRTTADPDDAKAIGRASVHRPDWEDAKLSLMVDLVDQKFTTAAFRIRLLGTGDALLVEENDWGDTYWGECAGMGTNYMGRILMAIRTRLRSGAESRADAGDLLEDLHDHPQRVDRVAESRLPTAYGEFRVVGYADRMDGREHLALTLGDSDGGGVLSRVHSECLTGDVFSSQRCDCGMQCSAALSRISSEGSGVLVYVRGHEGRGIGLLAKLKAHQLQDAGMDTVDANLALGLPVDARDYGVATSILQDLGVRSVRLLSNNPRKRLGLEYHGLKVAEMVPLLVKPGSESHRYLWTKLTRLDHHLPHLAQPPVAAQGDATCGVQES